MNYNLEYLNDDRLLPESYGIERLILLPRDPHWLFSYWEITPGTYSGLRKEGIESLILRVKRLSQDTAALQSYYDINMPRETNNWYINTGIADTNYQVELGWRSPINGQFFLIMTSNIVRTPPDSISRQQDEEWMLPNGKNQRLYRRLVRSNMSSFEFFLWSRRQRSKESVQHAN